MHRLLEIQLKKSFGTEWKTAVGSEFETFLDLVDQSYRQFDDDYKLVEHILDVSSKELTEANRDIGKSHELLHSVTESIRDLIFYKDLDFKYIGCNQSFATFFGYSVEEIVGKDDFELFDHEYATVFREMDMLMMGRMAPRTNQEWVRNAQGNSVLNLTTKAPLISSKGELFGLVGIARDITKEHHLEREVKAQQAMLIQQSRLAAMGEMIGNIAHQWRQPLNTLGLIVQDIEEAYEFGEMDKEYLHTTSSKAMEQINYMSQTIDDFRNFFNPDKSKKSFSLLKAVQNTAEILSAGMKIKKIGCSMFIPDDLMIFGYKNEFSQVLFNLFNNAKDAILAAEVINPEVTIHAQLKGEKIQIDISDNGGGIPLEILPRIFDPYFSTKAEGKGSGIGLYMSKMIIEEHMGGSLSVQNSDTGACFSILFPLPASLKGEESNND